MIDRLGSRLVISGCGVLTAIGGILFSQAGSLAAAMTARMMIGVGTASVLMAPSPFFQQLVCHGDRQDVGFMVAVGNLEHFCHRPSRPCNWRASFLAIGAVQAFATCWFFLNVQDRPATDEGIVVHPFLGICAGVWREIFGNRDFWLLGDCLFWYVLSGITGIVRPLSAGSFLAFQLVEY
jgi:hypothetical protein